MNVIREIREILLHGVYGLVAHAQNAVHFSQCMDMLSAFHASMKGSKVGSLINP